MSNVCYLRRQDLSLFSQDSFRLDEKLTCVDSQKYTIRQLVCGQYTKHWKALAITTQKKKNLVIPEYDTLAITPAANRMRQLFTWIRVQCTIVTQKALLMSTRISTHIIIIPRPHISLLPCKWTLIKGLASPTIRQTL